MAEGHSFHLANNVILIAYSWAYDRFKQALDRVHRMNSLQPVNGYVVLCQGSIDRKLESLVQEKSDAAELVLDGQLIGEPTEEVNLAELLNVARREFNEKSNTLDEVLLQTAWHALRQRLGAVMRAWDHGVVADRQVLVTPLVETGPVLQPSSTIERHDPLKSLPQPQTPAPLPLAPALQPNPGTPTLPMWKARLSGRLALLVHGTASATS